MRKVFLYFLICLCLPAFAYAAPCYGPRMPESKHFFLGLQSYSVFKRSMENDFGKIRSQQEFLLISYGILDWLSLDLKGGAGNITRTPDTGSELKYPAFVGGGYGFRIRLYDVDKTKLIFGFQHISIHPHTLSAGGAKHKSVLDNWQFSFLVSHDFSSITPYIGAAWSRMDDIHWTDTNRKLEKSDLGKSAGLVIGTDIPLRKDLWFNVEGRFFDETSVAASLNFAF